MLDTVEQAGANPCPPIVLGIGIGGSFDHCAALAKKALLRPLDEPNADPYYAVLEKELLDAKARTWNFKLIRELGLPEYLFGEVVMPGTSRGFLKPEIKEQIGIDYEVEVIAVASHDTASAASVVPLSAEGEKVAFLSSGTWSLLGVMSDEPILTEEARLAGFTNEGGTDGKSVSAEYYRTLDTSETDAGVEGRRKGCSLFHLLPAAEVAETDALIDVDDTVFQCPVSMAEAITNYCDCTSATSPSTQGEFVNVSSVHWRCAIKRYGSIEPALA